jgi:fructokinase
LEAEPSRSAIERAVEIAYDAQVPVCFDVNLRPTLWPSLGVARGACLPIVQSSTLLKLSLDDARHLFDIGDDPHAVMAELRRLPPRFAVLTDGARGAWFAVRGTDDVRHVPAFPVEAVEPTGAGDAFTAALISRLRRIGWDGLGDEDVRYASAAGALATTKPGAMEGLPTTRELDGFLFA